MQDNPKYTDGRSGLSNPLIENLCEAGVDTTYQRYQYLGDNLDKESIEKEHTDADGGPLGSDTREGFEKGAVSIQFNRVTDNPPRPGHVIRLDVDDDDGWAYYIAGKLGRTRARGDIMKASLQLRRAVNPVVANLLSSAYGQGYRHTQAAGALSGSFLTANTLNTRSGSTLAYALSAASGNTVPGWLSINSSSGLISGTAVAGTFEVEVVVTETLANAATRVGFGILQLIIT
jgi:hypothetical protein